MYAIIDVKDFYTTSTVKVVSHIIIKPGYPFTNLYMCTL